MAWGGAILHARVQSLKGGQCFFDANIRNLTGFFFEDFMGNAPRMPLLFVRIPKEADDRLHQSGRDVHCSAVGQHGEIA